MIYTCRHCKQPLKPGSTCTCTRHPTVKHQRPKLKMRHTSSLGAYCDSCNPPTFHTHWTLDGGDPDDHNDTGMPHQCNRCGIIRPQIIYKPS